MKLIYSFLGKGNENEKGEVAFKANEFKHNVLIERGDMKQQPTSFELVIENETLKEVKIVHKTNEQILI